MKSGRIYWLTDRRFGFIVDDRTASRYFFHKRHMLLPEQWPTLNEGDWVMFEAATDWRGPMAICVQVTRPRLPAGVVRPRRQSKPPTTEPWQRALEGVGQKSGHSAVKASASAMGQSA